MHIWKVCVCLGYACVLFFLFLTPSLIAESQEAFDYRTQGFQAQQKGDLNSAIDFYQKSINTDPAYAAPHNDLGVIYEMLGKLDQAERSYLNALQIDPNYRGVYSNLALLYEKKGDYQRSLAYWDKRTTFGAKEDPWVQKAAANAERMKSLIASGATPAADTFAPTAEYQTAEIARMMAEDEELWWDEDISGDKRTRKRELKKYISKAKDDLYSGRYQDALDNLFYAKEVTDDVQMLDELIDEVRSRSIDYELARASVNSDLYKKTKLAEVENAWFPPIPEIESIAKTPQIKTTTKSEARLELERKAREVIPSIDFKEAQLKEVIEFLAVSNDINIVIDETVVPRDEKVTVYLKNIPLHEALDIILRTKGLKYRFEENIVWITTEEKLLEEDLVVRVYDVQDLVGKLFDFPSEPFDFRSNLELGESE